MCFSVLKLWNLSVMKCVIYFLHFPLRSCRWSFRSRLCHSSFHGITMLLRSSVNPFIFEFVLSVPRMRYFLPTLNLGHLSLKSSCKTMIFSSPRLILFWPLLYTLMMLTVKVAVISSTFWRERTWAWIA